MKEPTTPAAIAAQEKIQINRKFLESRGWVLDVEKPLFETFKHSNDELCVCSISMYGGFSIAELHWMNKTPEKEFSTMNANLVENDYDTILRLLNINL